MRHKVHCVDSKQAREASVLSSNWLPVQVVQVCAEHKKPKKLLKHLHQIKVCNTHFL
jgi:hypothetical protein